MDTETTIRYLLPRSLFEELRALVPTDSPEISPVGGYIFAQYKAPFVIVDSFKMVATTRNYHDRPKRWIILKRYNIHTIREYKATKKGHNDQPITVVYPFHTHPTKDEKLHPMDEKILEYYGTGVMVICTPTDVVGWYYHCIETDGRRKKEWIPMNFEVIEEAIPY